MNSAIMRIITELEKSCKEHFLESDSVFKRFESMENYAELIQSIREKGIDNVEYDESQDALCQKEQRLQSLQAEIAEERENFIQLLKVYDRVDVIDAPDLQKIGILEDLQKDVKMLTSKLYDVRKIKQKILLSQKNLAPNQFDNYAPDHSGVQSDELLTGGLQSMH
ncbi:unnamed protein product [Dracunculus medinensis]|uniref:ING domain-containing protein n=1 Tax=Dracunculus medinensis TaxID=318479 RepID=A0A0N4UQ03_DRAME|nr:unnamed protein product [Dracunculus medinensis]